MLFSYKRELPARFQEDLSSLFGEIILLRHDGTIEKEQDPCYEHQFYILALKDAQKTNAREFTYTVCIHTPIEMFPVNEMFNWGAWSWHGLATLFGLGLYNSEMKIQLLHPSPESVHYIFGFIQKIHGLESKDNKHFFFEVTTRKYKHCAPKLLVHLETFENIPNALQMYSGTPNWNSFFKRGQVNVFFTLSTCEKTKEVTNKCM